MSEILIEYVLILLLVSGLGYLVYLLKDNDVNFREDYYGLEYIILGSLSAEEATPENIKKILRIVSDGVQYVEINYKNSANTVKEQEAIVKSKDAISLIGFKSNIDNDSLKYLTRLAVALLPPTNKLEK
ncbi:hypothetical protein K9O30_14890 [Clostridium bowmanii]|uniref:hypothetical protein n=1 Tax=Clostridium bowmanii TaxID=132925 RepID=UPI001C0D4928|nr:hypothetical protein [Clostridium bowmanii]MBU3190771.1 hypothetical protein [Clostridium bowmanii]MCA1074983.1 hypothetical protein [Clostridium bowmanii]